MVIATILKHAGSTPRTAGSKMTIRSDNSIIGTIGGGLVEAEVIKTASMLFVNKGAMVSTFDLSKKEIKDSFDVICGGSLTVLLEFIEANTENIKFLKTCVSAFNSKQKHYLIVELKQENDKVTSVDHCLITEKGLVSGKINFPESFFETIIKKTAKQKTPSFMTIEKRQFYIEPISVPKTVFLFGAGHVSQHLATITKMVGFKTVVLDDREEFANKNRFKYVDEVILLNSFTNSFDNIVIDNNSYIVIVTRGHSHDKTVLSKALKTSAKYIGMIGSRKKRDAIYNALLNEGFTLEDLKKVRCPIGLKINAETPEEIAVSIVAELISIRSG